MNESFSLAGLFLSSFLAATLLPGGSEFVLAGVIATGAAGLWPSLLVATVGNTLGGTTSWLLGRLIPGRVAQRVAHDVPQHVPRYVPRSAPRGRALDWVRRWGAPVLVLSWVPIIGDALCVAAGWLGLNLWWSILFMALGKFARYYVIGQILT